MPPLALWDSGKSPELPPERRKDRKGGKGEGLPRYAQSRMGQGDATMLLPRTVKGG